MKNVKSTYSEYAFEELKRFIQGVDFRGSNDPYNFLEKFIPQRYAEKSYYFNFKVNPTKPQTNVYNWIDDKALNEAIDFLFYLYQDAEEELQNSIKAVIVFCFPTVYGKSQNADEFTRLIQDCCWEKSYKMIARTFGINIAENEFHKWLIAISNSLGQDYKRFTNVSFVAKEIRNSGAHSYNIPRDKWKTTLLFMLHGLIGTCLLLIKTCGISPKLKEGFNEFRKERVTIKTSKIAKVAVYKIERTPDGKKKIVEPAEYSDVEASIADRTFYLPLYESKEYQISVEIDDDTKTYDRNFGGLSYTENGFLVDVNCQAGLVNILTNITKSNPVSDTPTSISTPDSTQSVSPESISTPVNTQTNVTPRPVRTGSASHVDVAPTININVTGGSNSAVSSPSTSVKTPQPIREPLSSAVSPQTVPTSTGQATPHTNMPPTYHINVTGGSVILGDNNGENVTGGKKKEPAPVHIQPHKETPKNNSLKWLLLSLAFVTIIGIFFLLGRSMAIKKDVTDTYETEQIIQPKPLEHSPLQGESNSRNTTVLPQPQTEPQLPPQPQPQPQVQFQPQPQSQVQPQPNIQPKVDVNYEAGMVAYNKGDGLEAISKFKASGSSEANYMLGVIYESGCGNVAANAMMARSFYKKAANQGHAEAEAKL